MATIVADGPVRCAGMTAWEFRPFVIGHPEVAWTMLGTIAARLRKAEERAEALELRLSRLAAGQRGSSPCTASP